MSLQDLRAALKRAPPRRAVFVSHALFWDLYDALELCPQRQMWRAPGDPACKKVLDALLANQQLPHSDRLEDITWHLARHGNVRVVRCLETRNPLADTGPGSFDIQ